MNNDCIYWMLRQDSREVNRIAVGDREAEACCVVDDDDAFRSSLIALLTSAGYSCQGYALATDFIAEAATLAPGLLLLDLRIPQMTGLDLLESHAALLERFAVVLISGHGDIERAVRSTKAGALDFIEQPFASDDLLTLVKAAHHALTRRTIDGADRPDVTTKVASLSPREAEVLRLLVAGAPNKIVARTLDLSVRTVEMHRANMLAKLGARSTAEAIHLAMLAEIVPWPLPLDRRYEKTVITRLLDEAVGHPRHCHRCPRRQRANASCGNGRPTRDRFPEAWGRATARPWRGLRDSDRANNLPASRLSVSSKASTGQVP